MDGYANTVAPTVINGINREGKLDLGKSLDQFDNLRSLLAPHQFGP
jgi:hypothetical protein